MNHLFASSLYNKQVETGERVMNSADPVNLEIKKPIIVSSVFNIIKTFSSLIFPVITFAYASRILGDVGIGQVNFAKSIVSYFVMFAMLGMNYYGTREGAKLRNDRDAFSKFAHEMLIINGITTIIAYVFLLISLISVPKLQDYRSLLLISSAAILLQGLGLEWMYQAIEEYRYIAIRSVVFQIIAFVALFLFVREKNDVIPYAIITVLAGSGSYLLNFLNARKYIQFRRYDHYEIRGHLKPIFWLFAMVVSIELYTVLDSTMLGFLKGDAAVGRYTAAVKVNKMVISLITAAGSVLIPRLSFYIRHNEGRKLNKLLETFYNYVFLISVPASIGLFMLSDDIIVLFSGNGFISAGLTMKILTPIVLVIPFSMTTNQQTLIPMGKEKLMLIATSVGAVVNLTLNGFLIPLYAENGAAIATVAAETAVAVISFFNIRKYFGMKKVFCRYWQYWVAAIPIPIAVYLIQLMRLQCAAETIISIAVSAVCYFCILLWLKNPFLLELSKKLLARITKKAKCHNELGGR